MLTHDNNSSNQEYLRGDRASEGADPEGGCPYHRRDEGLAEAFGVTTILT